MPRRTRFAALRAQSSGRPSPGLPALLLATLSLVAPLLVGPVLMGPMAPAALAGTAEQPSAEQPSAEQPRALAAGDLLVVSANLREGSRARRPVDLAYGADRRRFVRRLMNRTAGTPAVIVLQEVYGSAGKYARVLNRHREIAATESRFRVVSRPSVRVGETVCAGRTREPHEHVKTTAILVDETIIGEVSASGAIDGWGRWRDHDQPGNVLEGCAQQPWILATLSDGRQARVVGVHTAPLGHALKRAAVQRVASEATALNATTPDAALIIAGDFNITRNPQTDGSAEHQDGPTNAGHKAMLDRGLADANHAARPTGRNGVIGYRGRVDFIYSDVTAVAADFDRCYRAGRDISGACRAKDVVFASSGELYACQRRAERHGTPGGRCPADRYKMYYSDHAMLSAVLRW